MDESEPPDIDRPSPARMYDYFLGGSHNFAVDRAAADAARSACPHIDAVMRANRSFLRRAVRHLASAGVEQFLDLGSGIPTVGNTHEIAQRANPRARVVYVDHEPIAVAHAQTILRGNATARAILGDLRNPGEVLGDPQVRALLDLDRPLGVLMVAVLHLLSDRDDPAAVVAAYRDALPTGSYLAISHSSTELLPPECAFGGPRVTSLLRQMYQGAAEDVTLRSRSEITAMLDGFELVPPGVEHLQRWHPDRADESDDRWVFGFVGVGRKV